MKAGTKVMFNGFFTTACIRLNPFVLLFLFREGLERLMECGAKRGFPFDTLRSGSSPFLLSIDTDMTRSTLNVRPAC